LLTLCGKKAVAQNYYLKVVNAIKELKENGQGYYFKEQSSLLLLIVPCVALLYFLIGNDRNLEVSDTTGDATLTYSW
jgi:hypothetical protein